MIHWPDNQTTPNIFIFNAQVVVNAHPALQKHLGYFNHILGCLSCISVTNKCYTK